MIKKKEDELQKQINELIEINENITKSLLYFEDRIKNLENAMEDYIRKSQKSD